jgi:Ca2+-binding RTX toxin-like protein
MFMKSGGNMIFITLQSGGDGNDVIHGDGGDDVLYGEDGTDDFWGTSGHAGPRN